MSDLEASEAGRLGETDVPMDSLRVNIARVLGPRSEAIVDQVLAEVRDSLWLALVQEEARREALKAHGLPAEDAGAES